MRKMNMSLKKFKRRHNVFLLCLFALALLCVLTSGKAYAAADPEHNTYHIEDSNISSVSLQYKDWNNAWHTVTPSTNHTFSEWEEIGFSMAYTIPERAMAGLTKQAKITYQVQGITKENKLLASTGNVYSSDGTKVGTYTISDSGLITISLEDYTVGGETHNQIEQNINNGSPIHGTVRFTAKVSELVFKEGTSNELKIGDFTLNVPMPENQSTGSSLNVNKSAGAINEKGEIAYTIDVYSKDGTDDKVTITDTMTGGTVLIYNLSDVTVKQVNDSGTTDAVKEDFSVNDNKKGFSFKLPKMAANSHYYITYKGKIDIPTDASATISDVKNTVKAETQKNDGTTLNPEHTVTTQVNPISKSGVYDQNSDTVTWTIKISSYGRDLNGYQIGDEYYGQTTFKNVTLTNAFGQSQQIDLPYTFPEGSTSNYTLTYTTEALQDVGSYQSKNTVTLTPKDGGTPYTLDGYSNYIGGFFPLVKQAGKTVESGPNLTVNWLVEINADKGDIKPGEDGTWTYTDVFPAGQTINSTMRTELPKRIKQALGNYYVESHEDSIHFTPSDTSSEITGFTITCHQVIPKGTTISFDYTTTVSKPTDGQSHTYTNTATISNKKWNQTYYANATYNPLVKKYDENSHTTADTTHDYYDTNLSEDGNLTGTGILKWRIQLTVPQDINDTDITLTEKLPYGVNLYESDNVKALTLEVDSTPSIFTGFTKDSNQHVESSSATVNCRETEIKATYDSTKRTLIWTIPKSLAGQYQGQKLDFIIAAQVDKDFIPSSTTGYNTQTFKNTVDVKVGDNEAVSASQTQIVSRDERHDALSKTCTQKENNTLEYELDINPEGKDYLANSETLTIQDVLTYGTDKGDAVLSLLPETVKLFKVENNTETPEDFSYTYDHQSEKESWSDYYNHTSTIEATVPDGKHLKLKYTYKANGDAGAQFNNVTNTATLKGIQRSKEEKTQALQFSVSDSAATADAEDTGVVIYKHDSENYNKGLAGAQFKLEKYIANTENQYQEIGTYITGEDGRIRLSSENETVTENLPGHYYGIKDLTFNQAYRLTEIKAPDDYRKNSAPLYFYIINSDIVKYPKNMPADFQGTEYHNFETIFRPNHTMSGKTSLNIEKRWIDKDGHATEAPANETATFTIHQVEKPFEANAKFILQGKDRTSDLNRSFDKLTSSGYANGTKLNIKITYDEYLDDVSQIKELRVYEEDGTRRVFSSNNSNGKTTYTLNDYVVQGNMNWKVFLDNVDPAYLNAEVNVVEQGQSRFDKKFDTNENVTVNAANNWQTTVNDLPLYGQETIGTELTDVAYAYYVEETAGPEGYLAYYSDHQQGVTEGKIVVTNQENLTDLELEKVWKDKDGKEIKDGLPNAAVFRLYRTGYDKEAGNMKLNLKDSNNTPINSSTLHCEDDILTLDGYPQGTKISYELSYEHHGYYSFSPVIKDDSNAEISGDFVPDSAIEGGQRKYTFTTEVGENSSYTLQLGGGIPYNATLKRTSIEVPTPVEGENKKPYPDQAKNRIELNAKNNWHLRVSGSTSQLGGLPKSKTVIEGGQKKTIYYFYQVVESEVDGYTTTYSANNDIGVENGKITATNTKSDTVISVKKNWYDPDGNPYTGNDKPDTIKFDLYRKTSSEPIDDIDFKTNISRNQTMMIPGNDINNQYPEGTKLKYRLTYKYWQTPNPKDKSVKLQISDKSGGQEQVLTDKEQNTNSQYSVFDFDIDLHKDNSYKLQVVNPNNSGSGDQAVVYDTNWSLTLLSSEIPNTYDSDDKLIDTCEAKETGNYTWTSDHLPKTGQITVNGQKKTGYFYYYVKEHPVDGFSTSYANNDGIIDGAKSGDIIIKNTKLKDTVINVRKEWQKEDGTPETPSKESINFNLIQKATTFKELTPIKVTTGSSNMNGDNFVGIPNEDFYASGSSLHYKITYDNGYDSRDLNVSISQNGTTIESHVNRTGGGQNPYVYEFDTGPLTHDTTISINGPQYSGYNKSDFTGEVTVAESGISSGQTTTEDRTLNSQPYQISAANNWEWYSTSDPSLQLPTSGWESKTIGDKTFKVPVIYQYCVEETNVPKGFKAIYRVGNVTEETKDESPAIPLGGTGTIINRNISTSITANKIWNGVSGDDLANKPAVYVTLHCALKGTDGKIIDGSKDYSGCDPQVGQSQSINLKDHNWTYTWTYLPKTGTYNNQSGTWIYWVEETSMTDYQTAYRYVLDIDSSITGDAEKTTAYQSDTFTTPDAKHGITGGTFVIMNMSKTTSISVEKEWQDGNGDSITPPAGKQAIVTLKRRMKTYNLKETTKTEGCPPAINVRMMTKAGTVQEIYQISDDKVQGSKDSNGNYTANITVGAPSLETGQKIRVWYKFSNQAEYDSQNVLQINPQNESQKHPTINLTIPKELLGENYINVDMMFSSYKDLEKTKIYNGNPDYSGTEIPKKGYTYEEANLEGAEYQKTLNSSNSWKYTWTNLPTGNEEASAGTESIYEYWVEETPIDGYQADYKTQDGTNLIVVKSDNDQKIIAPQGTTTIITNKEVEAVTEYSLPSTGSMGLWIMMAIGLGLMGYGAWRYQKSSGKPDKPNGENTDESG